MKVQATAKYVRTSPRKIGLVADLIRGRQVEDALALLRYSGKRAAEPVGLVVQSAIANAEENHNLKTADLRIERISVGPGPTLKRFRARARGAAAPIRRRTSNITVTLSDEPAAKKTTKEAK